MIMAGAWWAPDPGPEPAYSKREEAYDRGFDPGEDHGSQPTSDGPLSPRLARWTHQGSVEGCEQCGERCLRCDERMCTHWGPEPRACSTTCADCPCDCPTCFQVREEMRADLRYQIERESR